MSEPVVSEEPRSFLNEVHYKLRYTFPNQNKNSIMKLTEDGKTDRDYKQLGLVSISRILLDVLVPHYTTKLVYGFENRNSRNEPTYTHCHIHFTSKSSRDTIAKALQRTLKQNDFPSTGPKVFALKPEVYVQEGKFFRYPLKQLSENHSNIKFNFSRCHGFSEVELETMRKVAHDQWLTSIEINTKKADKADTSDSLFQRLSEYAENHLFKNRNGISLRAVQKIVLAFYVSEERPLNFQTMSGYAYILAYKNNIIDEDQMLDKFN